MTVPNASSYGVKNENITNVFIEFSSYLSVFITLGPISFKKYERQLLVAFVVLCIVVTEFH